MRSVGNRIGAYVIAGLVGLGCKEGEVTNITFDEIGTADAADETAFKSRFENFKGKKVAWQGTVVEARRVFGDDFTESCLLLVDMDGTADDPVSEEIEFEIPPSKTGDLKPGQRVKFVAVLREFDMREGQPVLKVQMKEVE